MDRSEDGALYERAVLYVKDGQAYEKKDLVRVWIMDDVLSEHDAHGLLALPVTATGEYIHGSKGWWIARKNFPLQLLTRVANGDGDDIIVYRPWKNQDSDPSGSGQKSG